MRAAAEIIHAVVEKNTLKQMAQKKIRFTGIHISINRIFAVAN